MKRNVRGLAVLPALVLALSLLPLPALAAADEDTLPAKFDLRWADLGDGVYRDYVTPVKEQNPYGTCWAFGGIAAAESSILSMLGMGYEESLLDLSEKHLAWFATHPVTEAEAPGQAGEGIKLFDEENNPNGVYNDGGFAIYVSTLFSSGVGPVTEASFPYRGKTGLTDYGYLLTDKGKAEYKENIWTSTRQEYERIYGRVPTDDELFELLHTMTRYAECDNKDEIQELVYRKALENKRDDNEYSDRDDWTIPAVSELDGVSLNRNVFGGYTLRDGNILPLLMMYDESGQYAGVNEHGVRAVKEELMAGRGVSISVATDQSMPNESGDMKYLSKSNWSHYTWESKSSNHCVCIVGWNDAYPRGNFVKDSDGNGPPGDGAWIVKNSWGSELSWIETTEADGKVTTIGKNDWGIVDAEGRHTGFFYVSYFDRSLDKEPESFRFDTDLAGGPFYASQYDYMPAYAGFGFADDTELLSTANVFTAEGDQWLTSVSTRTAAEDANVTFAVYLLDADAENPEDGTQATVQQARFDLPGYHRVDLEKPVALREGQRFSVVSTTYITDDETGADSYLISFDVGFGEAMSRQRWDTTYCTAVVNEGESWLYADGEWEDWFDSDGRVELTNSGFEVDNFSIKAFGLPIEASWNAGALTLSRLPGGVRAIAAAYDASGRLAETKVFLPEDNMRWTPDADAAELKVFYIDDALQPLFEPTVLPPDG